MTKFKAVDVQRGQLSKVTTPAGTDTWTPVRHSELADLFEKEVKDRGFRVVEEKHRIAKDGLRYFGVLYLERPSKEKAKGPRDFDLMLGIRNANDRSIAVGGVAGNRVIVCDNMVFSGEEKFAQRHTKNVEAYVPAQVKGIVEKLMGRYKIQDDRIRAYKTTELGDTEANDLIIKALDEGVISGSDIPNILTEWRTPRHPEFAESKTIWRLFNSFTENFKTVSLFDLPRRSDALHAITDAAAKFAINN